MSVCAFCALPMANHTFGPLQQPLALTVNLFSINAYSHARVKWIPAPVTKSTLCHESRWAPTRNPTFHPFSRLPLELRLMIWRYAIPNDRVIEIRSWGNFLHAPIKYSVAPHQTPAVLQVNQESRQEALRSYRLVEIGVSTWRDYDPSNTYIPWQYHAANPNSDPKYTVWVPPPGRSWTAIFHSISRCHTHRKKSTSISPATSSISAQNFTPPASKTSSPPPAPAKSCQACNTSP
jgi:hypothetical protein